MTLGVVFFGFFPLYLSLVKVDGDLTKEINVLVLLFSAGYFVPYISLLLESIYRRLVRGNEKVDSENCSNKNNCDSLLEEIEGRGGSFLGGKKNFKLNKSSINQQIKDRNSKTLTFIGVLITLTICYLLVFGKVAVDSAALLSLILAFFSMYLSATFYFKSTEQSNQFYDRSYNHTRDIAKTLSAMEGKFGEGLRNIENHNIKLNDRIEKFPLESINRKNDEIDIVLQEKEKLIQELLDKSSIEEGKREEYKQQLMKFESQNYGLKRQLEKLISKSNNTKVTSNDSINLKSMMKNPNVHPGFLHKLLYDVGPNKILSSSDIEIGRVFNAYKEINIPDEVLTALHHLNYVDNESNITDLGIHTLKSLAEDFIN